MKRSTGGLVLLERTSVKDGSLFLRLLTQSSICRFSSSILSRLLDVSNGLGKLVGDGKTKTWVQTKDNSRLRKTHLVFQPSWYSHSQKRSLLLYERFVSCAHSRGYGQKGRGHLDYFKRSHSDSLTFVLPGNLSLQNTQSLKNTTQIYQFWSGKRLIRQQGCLLDLVGVHYLSPATRLMLWTRIRSWEACWLRQPVRGASGVQSGRPIKSMIHSAIE